MQRTNFIGILSMLAPNKGLSKTIKKAYKNGPDFREIIQRPKEQFEIRNGMLYRESRLCILKGDIHNKLLHDYYSTPSTGHLGESKILNRLFLKYYKRSMRNTLREYIRSCQTCQQIKARNHKPYGLLNPIEPTKSK